MEKPGRYDPTQPVFREAHSYIYQKKTNFMMVCTGPVGTGKSVTGVTVGYRFSPRFDMRLDIVYSVPQLLERSLESIRYKGRRLDIAKLMSIPELDKWIAENRDDLTVIPGRALVFDETGSGAFVREFMKLDNRTMAKMVQIWRWLRILIVLVVPVDINLMDSAIIKFLNMELRHIGYPEEKGHAEFVAMLYGKWNRKKREPYKRRIRGCRGQGTIRLESPCDEFLDMYNGISGGSKVGMLMELLKKHHKEEKQEKFTKKDAIIGALRGGKLSNIEIARMFNTDPAYVRQIRGQLGVVVAK